MASWRAELGVKALGGVDKGENVGGKRAPTPLRYRSGSPAGGTIEGMMPSADASREESHGIRSLKRKVNVCPFKGA